MEVGEAARSARRWPAALFVVRHGESLGNVARDAAQLARADRIAVEGRDVDVALSALGERQAGALGRWFADMPAAERPDTLLVSPYARAISTARAVRDAGSLMAALGGLDALVFTAGIGEHAPAVRAAICAGLAWAGIALDETRNEAGAGRISRDGSGVAVYVIPADEEAPIARAVDRLVFGALPD